jgi:hypothetical protein
VHLVLCSDEGHEDWLERLTVNVKWEEFNYLLLSSR